MRRSLTLVVGSLLVTGQAYAIEDCPPGSVSKTEDGYSWCEPTVCMNDGQCKPNEVCRPVALCMEVGTLSERATTDGSNKLVVTQRCGPDKACPTTQTCSDLSRCVTKAAAEKMGILAASSATATNAPEPPKKSSCGCDAVGAERGAAGFVLIGLLGCLFSARVRAARCGSSRRR